MIPYDIAPVTSGIAVPAGQTVQFAFNFPGQATISKLIISRLTGTGAFSAVIYSKSDQGAVPDLYRASPTFNSSGNLIQYFADTASGGHGLVFLNQDPRVNGNNLGKNRKVYIKITNSGGDDATYGVALGGMVRE